MPNDVSGNGQFHFGLLKKPVNGGSDITKSGQQPSGINEGIIYSGIFEEDSSAGIVTKSISGSVNASASASSSCGRSVRRRSGPRRAELIYED